MKRKRRLKIKVRKVVKKLGRPSLYPQGTEMSVLRRLSLLSKTNQQEYDKMTKEAKIKEIKEKLAIAYLLAEFITNTKDSAIEATSGEDYYPVLFSDLLTVVEDHVNLLAGKWLILSPDATQDGWVEFNKQIIDDLSVSYEKIKKSMEIKQK